MTTLDSPMVSDAERAAVQAMLCVLRAGHVRCGEDEYLDWVNDNATNIRRALLAAGWVEPPSR